MIVLVKEWLKFFKAVYDKYLSPIGLITRQLNIIDSKLASLKELKQRKFLARKLPALSKEQKEILEELRGSGFCKTNLSTLKISDDLLVYLENISQAEKMGYDEVASAQSLANKKYWTDLGSDAQENFLNLDPILKNKFLLDIISHYIGQIPTFGGFRYLYSPPFPVSKTLSGSQNWHLDNHHKNVLKLFFSPFPIGKMNGPTQVLPSDLSTKRHYTKYPHYMVDDELRRQGVRESDQHFLTSEPGEIYLVDTSRCLHCGSRNEMPRHLAIASFQSMERYIPRWSVDKLALATTLDVNKKIIELYS